MLRTHDLRTHCSNLYSLSVQSIQKGCCRCCGRVGAARGGAITFGRTTNPPPPTPPPPPPTHKTEEPVALHSNLNQIFIEANRCFTHKGIRAHLQMPDPHLGACVVAR